MKKILTDITQHLHELDNADGWILLRSTSIATLLGFGLPCLFNVLTASNVKEQKKFIKEHAAEFGCNYTKKFHPICPDDVAEAKLFDASDAYIGPSSKAFDFSMVFPLLLLFVGIGLLWSLFEIRGRHHQKRHDMQSQQKTAQLANLAELEVEAKKYSKSYGHLHRKVQNSQVEHPSFLCEPESKKLLGMPPIGCSDGYGRGFYQFKKMLLSKKNSVFTNKPLAPYGIIDITLMGNLVAYIQGHELPVEKIITYSQYTRIHLLFKSIINLFLEIFGSIKFATKALILPTLVSFFILSLFVYYNEVNHKKFYFLSFDGRPREDYLSSLPYIIGISLAVGMYYRFDELVFAVNNWFNRKIQQADTVTITDNLNIPGKIQQAPDLFTCPISHELFEDPVICEDGKTYERKSITTFFELQPVKKSPINRDFIFKNTYPLLWSYTQRKQQVQQFKIDQQNKSLALR